MKSWQKYYFKGLYAKTVKIIFYLQKRIRFEEINEKIQLE